MDKKNTLIGASLLAAAFAVFMLAPKSPAPTQPATAQPATDSATTPGSVAPAATTAAPNGTFATIARDAAEATLTTLANEFIEARLTNFGGAVREVAFKQYPEVQGQPAPYVFNRLHEDPILAFTDFPGLGRTTAFEVVRATPTEVVYRTVLDGRIEVTRRYALTDPATKGGDPYRLRHETTFRNLTDGTAPLPRAALSLGTATLLNVHDAGLYLNVTSHDGEDLSYTERGDLEGGGFGSLFGSGRAPVGVLEKPGAVAWAAVKNQFFASIYTPDQPGIAVIARRIELPPFPNSTIANIGMTGATRFDLAALAPNGTLTLGGHLYVGPSEYKRLAKFEKQEDGVMQYSKGITKIFLSGYVAPLENTLMNLAHKWVGNWGVAIILMTLILKIVSLPFTIAASRSAKRMAKLQPEMKEIREKYKDNPQKQQMATMELFKRHKVNPMGGCIPILITMPLFFGFFAMLQSAPELRFQPFLWARDLSAPDTVGHLFGFPINIMPVLLGITTLVQMQLTPTASLDKTQAFMMKLMPIVFVAFCYNFSCALALYSTINGIFTIGQQLVINKMKDPEPGPAGPGSAATVTAASFMGKKKMKNVTPKKKG